MKSKSLTVNIISNFIHKLVLAVVPTIIYIYVIRVIGMEYLGESEYIHSYSSYFETLALLSLPLLATSMLSKFGKDIKQKYKTKVNLFFVQLVLTIIATTLFFILATILNLWEINSRLTLIWGFYILTNAFNISWLFQANERFDILAWITIILKSLTVIIIYIFIQKSEDYINYYLILLIMQIINMLVYLILDDNKITIKSLLKHLDKQIIKTITKSLAFLCIPVITARVIFSLDKTFIGLIAGNEMLGYYSVVFKIIITVATFIATLIYVFVPHNSKKINNNKNISKYLQSTTDVMSLFTVPICFGVALLASEIFTLFSGHTTSQSVISLIVMSPVILFYSLKSIWTYQVYIPYEKHKEYALINGGLLIVDVVLNYILILKFSIIGAAATMTIVYLLELFISIRVVKPLTGKIYVFRKIAKYLLICLIFIPIVYLVRITLLNYISIILISFILCVIIYFIILILIKDKVIIMIVETIKSITNKMLKAAGRE